MGMGILLNGEATGRGEDGGDEGMGRGLAGDGEGTSEWVEREQR